jgi:glycerophosphoryl diester phosphodiesterase
MTNYWLNPTITTPLIIGHRGAKMHYPENTIGSMLEAHSQGAHGIEFDVRLCKSGEVIVIHDLALERTTNGRGDVNELTLDQIRTVDAGKGEKIPTLHEVFEALNTATTGGMPFVFNVELKNNETVGDGLEVAVAKVVEQHKMGDRVVFSSFSPSAILEIRKYAPNVPRGFLYYGEAATQSALSADLNTMGLSFHHPYFRQITSDLMATLRERGLGVNTWTVNERADIAHMIEMGVTGIIGDSPITILEVLNDTANKILGNAPAPKGGGGWG